MNIPVLQRKYAPRGNRVLLRPIENTQEDRMRGSIELAEDSLPLQHAEVISVGPGEVAMQTGELIPVELAVGDLVLIRKGLAHLPVRQNGEDLMLVREGDIEASVG